MSLNPIVIGSVNTLTGLTRHILSWINMPSLSGIRIEAEEHEEILTSKISEQMIINLNGSGKQIISDNIVPIPRSWNIAGYIGSATVDYIIANNPPFAVAGNNQSLNSGFNQLSSLLHQQFIPLPGIEPTIYFMPSLKQQVQILRNAWINYKLVWFKDKYGTYTPVGIEKLSFKAIPSVQNKVAISVVLKEVVTYNGYTSWNGYSDPTNSASSYISSGGGQSSFIDLANPAASPLSSVIGGF